MKVTHWYFLGALVWMALIYGGFAFCLWQIDPSKWDGSHRFFLCFLYCFVIGAYATEFNSQKSSKK